MIGGGEVVAGSSLARTELEWYTLLFGPMYNEIIVFLSFQAFWIPKDLED